MTTTLLKGAFHRLHRTEAWVAATQPCSDLGPVVDAELHRLPAKYRRAVILCDMQGLTRREAADRLGCPEGTLSTWLLRARHVLAERLTRRGVSLSAVA